MTDAELTEHINKLRALRTSAQTQKAAVKAKTAAPKAAKEPKPTIDISKYL